MDENLKTASIAAVVAFITSLLSALLTFYGIQQQQHEWLSNTLSANLKDLYSARLEVYPELHQLVGELSSKAKMPLNREKCVDIAERLNEWYYKDGLILGAASRRAVLSLRNRCLGYSKGEFKKADVIELRNLAHIHMRADLNLDTDNILYTDPESVKSALEKARERLEKAREPY